MATETPGGNIPETAPATSKAKAAEKNELPTRVSRKINKNQVEVTFGADAKKGAFNVYDSGSLKGTGTRKDEDSLIVDLSRFLESGRVHDFAVVFAD